MFVEMSFLNPRLLRVFYPIKLSRIIKPLNCIFVANSTHVNRTFFSSLNACEFNCLITNQSCVFINASTSNDPVFSIAFQSGHKEDSTLCQLFILRIVVIALINCNNTSLWKTQCSTDRNVRCFTLSDRHKLR
jgi:hypothetical protein